MNCFQWRKRILLSYFQIHILLGIQKDVCSSAILLGTGAVSSSSLRSLPREHTNRRNAIQSATKILSGVIAFSSSDVGSAEDWNRSSSSGTSSTTTHSALASNSSSSYSIYRVMTDASLKDPHLKQIQLPDFYHNLQNASGALWLGEHHNSANDHRLQADMIQQIYSLRTMKNNDQNNMAIGLEQVQIQYQPILDDFIAGRISESEMLKGVEWSIRWTWPYENYKPIFDIARDLQIPLIALNVNSEDLAVVEVDGLNGLNQMQLMKYIMDPYGFGDFCKTRKFKTYSAYVIEPSYDLHEQMGILKTTISGQKLQENMSFRNFFSGRILWDESMAGNAFAWTKKNPGGLLIGLVGADHIKFELGVVGRFDRFLQQQQGQNKEVPSTTSPTSVSSTSKNHHSSNILNTAMILNPTLIDSRPSGSVSSYTKTISPAKDTLDQITLQLRYLKDDLPMDEDRYAPSSTGGVLKFSDYIVVNR